MSNCPLAVPVEQSRTQTWSHNFIGHLQTNCDIINKPTSRSGSGVEKTHSLIVRIPTLHANLLHDAWRTCQKHSLLSNVLTFLSCWKTSASERGDGYSWCATAQNTCRDYVRAVTFWSGLWPALLLYCFEDQSDIRSDRPPRSAPLGGWIDVLMRHQRSCSRRARRVLILCDVRRQRRHYQYHTIPKMGNWQCVVIHPWWSPPSLKNVLCLLWLCSTFTVQFYTRRFSCSSVGGRGFVCAHLTQETSGVHWLNFCKETFAYSYIQLSCWYGGMIVGFLGCRDIRKEENKMRDICWSICHYLICIAEEKH